MAWYFLFFVCYVSFFLLNYFFVTIIICIFVETKCINNKKCIMNNVEWIKGLKSREASITDNSHEVGDELTKQRLKVRDDEVKLKKAKENVVLYIGLFSLSKQLVLEKQKLENELNRKERRVEKQIEALKKELHKKIRYAGRNNRQRIIDNKDNILNDLIINCPIIEYERLNISNREDIYTDNIATIESKINKIKIKIAKNGRQ